MKVLRVILIILLALVAVVLIKTYTSDPDFNVNRSITVDASASAIWPYVSNLEKADEWNAWLEIDPETKKEYGGEQGSVGSWASWDSEHQDVGSGKQTITNLQENQLVETELRFGGWDGSSIGYTSLEEKDGATEVTFGFRGTNDTFFARAFMSFMDMDAAVGPMFEKGLANLKGMVESNDTGSADEKLYRGYSITDMNRDQMVYIGKRDRIAMEDMKPFFEDAFPSTAGAISAANINMAGAPSALYFEWNEEEGMVELLAGIPVVGDENTTIDGFDTYVVPSSRALNLTYKGAYEGIGEAHYAMEDKMKEAGLEFDVVCIEEYVTDPGEQPDTSQWVTELYYMIK